LIAVPLFQTLRSQLVLTIVIVAMALALREGMNLRREFDENRTRANELTLSVAQAVSGNVELFLWDERVMLARLSEDPRIREMEGVSCSRPLMEVRPLLQFNVNLLVVDSVGRMRCSGLGPPQPGVAELGDRDWFSEVRQNLGFYVGGPLVGRHTGQWVAPLVHPILTEQGEFMGAVVATVDLERFQSLLDSRDLPAGAIITIAAGGERVLARSGGNAADVGTSLPSASDPLSFDEQDTGISRARGLDGIDRVWGYRRVPGTDWVVFAGLDEDILLERPRRELRNALAAGVTIVLLLTLLLAGAYQRFYGSLRALVEGTRMAAQGDPSMVPTSGPMEIVEVGRQVRRTLEQRRRAEQGVRRAVNRWRSILEHAGFGVFLADGEGVIRVANPAMARIMETERAQDLRGIRIPRLFLEAAQGEEFLRELAAKGAVSGAEFQWRTLGGHVRTVRITGSEVSEAARGETIQLFAEDITESVELHAQLLQAQKMDAVGRLAGGVAHDLNNLLTVIQGHSEILLGKLDEEDRTYHNVSEIHAASERAANLTRQLLAFSRQEEPDSSLVDLGEMVRGMEGMCARLIGERIALHVNLEDGLLPVLGNVGQLEQVLLNLVVNARDAMPEGGDLSISTRSIEDGPEETPEGSAWVCLEVADTGHGMEDEVQARIFDPFFTTKAPGEGSGLGLATVYGIVSGMGGRILVNSRPGVGTQFEVVLPAGEPGRREPEPAARVVGDLLPETGTVLVVEDEGAVREIIVRILSDAGFLVREASNGDEAVVLARDMGTELDLVVTDVVMPGLRGPEMVTQIRRTRPGVPVLFLSGYVGDSLEIPALPQRAGFLAKPFRPSELLTAVAGLLSGSGVATGPQGG
jgi:PAS domain S-box-containing protein